MALKGNLRDFSLPDVFQLVTLSRKTGVLRIARSGAEGSVWFREGEVFFATSNWHRDPLGQRLVAAEKLTPAALQRALELRAAEPEGGRRLGQILVDEGYISDKVLEAFVQEQIQDTIFDLMRWDEGDFHFDPLESSDQEDIGLSVSIENVIMEGSRRLEEWTRIKKKIPSTDIVFKMATAPGEGTFEISLKPVEWNLLLLVDGTRSVSQLAGETGRTDFEVARVVYGLFSAGLLEVASDEEVERLRKERAEREAARAAASGAPSPPAAAPPAPSAAPPAPAPAAPVAPAPPSVEQPAAPAPAPPAAVPAPPAQPAVPAEMPEFLAPQHEPSAEDLAVFERMMGAVLTPPSGAAETPQPQEAAAAPQPAPVREAAAPEVPAPPFADIPQPPSAEPIGVAEPMSARPEGPAAPVRTGDLEADLMALGLGELPVEAPPSPPAAESPVPAGEEALAEPGVAGPDLSDLLDSLDEEPPVPSAAEPAGLISTGPAEDGPAEPTEVISTDAFLKEFDSGPSVGLSSGLGDELTALTGGGAAPGRSRHVTNVNRIPEADEDGVVLHRDQMVDEGLVRTIIEGVKRL